MALALEMALEMNLDLARPSLWERRGEYTWASFPSGHAMAMMSVLLIAAWLAHRERGSRWPYALWALTFVPMVYSRIYLGVHWPTDVVAGLLVGSIWCAAVWLASRRRQTVERHPFAL